MDSQDSPSSVPFIPPSIHASTLLAGDSYTHYSPCPPVITPSTTPLTSSKDSIEPTPCVLGVDEAGRGPVLGPMVYSAFYLPLSLHHSLLAEEHHFDDSKVLTPAVRSNLMHLLCSPDNSLSTSCGWGVKVMSARDISAGMLRPRTRNYNLNAQAMDATTELIRCIVEEKGVNVREVYIDTIGNPETYQRKLERVFPSLKITVAKKADSLYPSVSAASICAKVTRDVALEICYEALLKQRDTVKQDSATEGWGSGYPSDSKCVSWLKNDMDTLFGWGYECRFSWGTARELLESKTGVRVDWPVEEDEEAQRLTNFFSISATRAGNNEENDELRDWYGQRPQEIF
ncbi:ribonuclease H2 subunit A [Blastomyces gilchristii SLH14081]|uniref:Ribonuclease n=1 Tax=Blastomyces gilchristii (strain SLH14081) TaxID=559298 RepID=A0A179UXD3_BLAGS|nr:ribonuclease H2 subunit A [Blastomyces gilchristii SLH14081]OAT11072.1 ribonuclease H2 subunit A [Blastomyces gilchristii SLH14081]